MQILYNKLSIVAKPILSFFGQSLFASLSTAHNLNEISKYLAISHKVSEDSLSLLHGKGPGKMIMKADILELIHGIKPAVEDTHEAPVQKVEKVEKKKVDVKAKKAPSKSKKLVIEPNPYEDIPLTEFKKKEAENLVKSKREVPHYYMSCELVIDDIEKLRAQLSTKDDQILLEAFYLKAMALACKAVPEINSTWLTSHIRIHSNVDVTFIAELENGGYKTPVIYNANNKGIIQISNEIKSLREKAKKNLLNEYDDIKGTYTAYFLFSKDVFNTIGIIRPDQACTLTVNNIEKKLTVNKDSNLITQTVSRITISADHRSVDGAVSTKWLQAFKTFIESPNSLML